LERESDGRKRSGASLLSGLEMAGSAMSENQRLDSADKKMLVAGGVALVFSVVAVGLTMIQTLANPSGTFVVGSTTIAVIAFIGMLGLAAFGLLCVARGNKETSSR
jgi:hypothetical protein